MMRKFLTSVIALVMALGFASCGRKAEPNSTEEPTKEQQTASQKTPESEKTEAQTETEQTTDKSVASESKQHILVAYFSATGTTEKLAEYAAETLGADIYEITPAEPYTDENLRIIPIAEPTESRLTRRQDLKFPARSRIWRNTIPSFWAIPFGTVKRRKSFILF